MGFKMNNKRDSARIFLNIIERRIDVANVANFASNADIAGVEILVY
jgi:hypothetical protein